jgi:hypothetical protein
MAVATVVGLLVPTSRVGAANATRDGVVVADRGLDEISGCAVSRSSKDMLWVHNDSGDSSRAYAVSLVTGKTMLTVSLKNTEATDNEDMAFHDGRIYLADIGDNKGKRKSVHIASFVEPKLPAKAAAAKVVKVEVKNRVLTYEDGPHDAEAFLIDPDGAMVIVTKSDGAVYRAGVDNVLHKVASIGVPLVTGADISPDGRFVLIRTYLGVLRYDRPAKSTFDAVWKTTPLPVAGPTLQQPEAVCIEPTTTAAWTTTESRGGEVRLYRLPLS